MKNIYMHISDFRKRRTFYIWVNSFISLSYEVERERVDAVDFGICMYVCAVAFIGEFQGFSLVWWESKVRLYWVRRRHFCSNLIKCWNPQFYAFPKSTRYDTNRQRKKIILNCSYLWLSYKRKQLMKGVTSRFKNWPHQPPYFIEKI